MGPVEPIVEAMAEALCEDEARLEVARAAEHDRAVRHERLRWRLGAVEVLGWGIVLGASLAALVVSQDL